MRDVMANEDHLKNPVTMLALRCKSCSAPLSAKPSDDIIRCEYCGSTQKLVDARAFYDQILGQVNAWIRQAMPPSIGATVSGITDPIARHMVFMNNVKPRLTTEYGEYRFNCFNVLSHPMIVLPHMTDTSIVPASDPKNVFLFQAKVQSIQPLAVDDDSKNLVAETGGLSIAYGYLLNNVGLMSELKPERYYFMTQNFEAAADAVKDIAKFSCLADRLKALAKLSTALDLIVNQKVSQATTPLREAEVAITKAETVASQNLEMGIMLQAIKMEQSFINCSSYLAEAQIMSTSGEYASGMIPINNLLGLLNSLQDDSPPKWQSRFRHVSHHEQILKVVSEIRRAKTRSGMLKILPGSGSILAPFWAIDIPYTFQTGALWKTQGVEVTESILVSATFPLDADAFGGTDPRPVLTDVFNARERRGFFNDSIKRLSGKETSISGGGPVRDAVRNAQPGYPVGMGVLPPLSTSQDAIVLVQEYVTRACQADRAIQNQLRLSAPRIVDLIFVPAVPDANRPNAMPWLGGLAPNSIGNLQILSSITL